MPYISKEALNDSPILGQLQDIFGLFLLLRTIGTAQPRRSQIKD